MPRLTQAITHAYVYIHEIGHALGLGHPGPYPRYADDGTMLPTIYGVDNAFLNDSDQATVMSYFNQEENTYIEASNATPVTPMIADIIAIQNLYGTPTDINLGDTVYGYGSNLDGYLGLLYSRWTGEENPFVGIDVGHYSTPTFADLDNDGDLDLVVGEHGALYYYEDTGSRSQSGFTERTGTANPLEVSSGTYIVFLPLPTWTTTATWTWSWVSMKASCTTTRTPAAAVSRTSGSVPTLPIP